MTVSVEIGSVFDLAVLQVRDQSLDELADQVPGNLMRFQDRLDCFRKLGMRRIGIRFR
ncbi:MAG: hypothetical protein R3A46_11870 [Thermomicrobiales bacterium]